MNGTFQRRATQLRDCRSSISGVALVIVLVMLTLMAILLIAFLNSAATELRSAKSYAVGLDAKALTDSAVNIVISQIQDATSAPTNAWASQPGMIRTYDTNGNLVTAYKLYSSSALRVSSFNPNNGPSSDPTSVSTDVPAASTWASEPDQYVDLNKPVILSGVTNYPIIDPAAVAYSQGQGPLSASPLAMDNSTNPIQGCYMDTTNNAITTSASQSNPVPMPVQWLYVLQNGEIIAPDTSSTSTSTTFTNATSVPSSSDPIVGRIAFWTDDESCKVNVNTSGEGSFWGRPHTESADNGGAGPTTGYEQDFLNYTLPAQNEFQRYPGHPAMTSLSVIFPALNGESTTNYNERIYGIIPRLATAATGTSQSGTVQFTINSQTPVPNSFRLFDTADEFMFSATNTTSPRTANYKELSPTATNFTDSDMEKARFFLTANSRSPEVNMFNKPRITLWPLQISPDPQSGAVTRTAKDNLIAFCSTIGAKTSSPLLYYFQRYNTYTTAARGAGTYPASLTQSTVIPSSQSTTLDWTWNNSSAVNRNQQLFTYLQYLCSNPIPGLGGSLTTRANNTAGKYRTSVCNQILTEMFDFIRSEITTATTGTSPYYLYGPGQTNGVEITGERQVVPLVVNPPVYPGNAVVYSSVNPASYSTKGFGRFETIQQAALVFYRQNMATNIGSTLYQTPQIASASNPVKIGVVLLLDPWNATPGSRSWSNNSRITVSGLGSCAVKVGNTIESFLATGGTNFIDGASLLLTGTDDSINQTALMGTEFFFKCFSGNHYKVLGPTTVGSATEEQYYPFYGQFNLTSTNSPFAFYPPANVVIKVYSGYDPAATTSGVPSPSALVQTINMAFPLTYNALGGTNWTQVQMPLPTVASTNANWYTDFNCRIGSSTNVLPYPYDPHTSGYNYYPAQGIDALVNTSPFGSYGHSPLNLFQSGDSARNLEARYKGPANGDLRVLNALTNVPPEYYDAYESSGLAVTGVNGTNYPVSDDSSGSSGYNSATAAIIHSMRMFAQQGASETSTGHGTYYGCVGYKGLLTGSYYGSFNPGSQVSKYDVYPEVPRGLTTNQVTLTGLNGATNLPGDWDTGPGRQPDGPYINKPDEGNSIDFDTNNTGNIVMDGYKTGTSEYGGVVEPDEQGTTYAPNRQISSAVAFGSLPTGIDPTLPDLVKPWQTLLFCANPASEAGNSSAPRHPGFGSLSGTATNAPPYTIPPDHAFLDFFTMPIVEPYAISEPFSTAGKVNMNYQIVPFTYLTRDTAVRAVLKSVRMMAIPSSEAGNTVGTVPNQTSTTCYKIANTNPSEYRYTINPDEVSGTLAGFQYRFNSGDIFRSASEICNLYLLPQYEVTSSAIGAGETVTSTAPPVAVPNSFSSVSTLSSAMNTWWKSFALTGDNVREEPYGYIYPRLTTKSDTYTVHVWTQTLKKANTTAAASFVDGSDQVTSEYRGSYIIQRYLDPNTDSLITSTGAAGSETDPNSMVGPYKFRVIAAKKFTP